MILDFLTKSADRVGRTPRRIKTLVGLVGLLLIGALAVPAVLMSQPGIMGRLGEFSDNYETLQSSMHADLTCNDCHTTGNGGVAGTFALTADFYRTVLTPEKDSAFVEMQSPANNACLKCHSDSWSHKSERTTRIPHPAHLRVSEETRDCVICHKWTAHLEDYLEEHKTMPFSGVCAAYECHAGWKTIDECADCHHTLLDQPAEWETTHATTVFNNGDGGCLELCHEVNQCQQCHTTGETPFTGVTDQTERAALEAAHGKADWGKVHGDRALADQASCLSCHISVGQCQNCHARRPASHGQENTWISAHKDAVKSDRHCVTCHEQSWCDHCHNQFKEMR